MFFIQIIIAASLSFSTGCKGPENNIDMADANVNQPQITTEVKTELPVPITTTKAQDGTETTTVLDVKKATPTPVKEAVSKTEVVTSQKEVIIETTPPKTTTEVTLATHEAFNSMLQKYVTDGGTVNYAAWKKSESDLDSYLQSLAAAIPSASTARNEALAYWINAYNAYTVKLILKNYPVAKITDLNGGKPWDVQWITLAGKKYSLNDIENKVIRPTFKEPRIHFAVNCAAKSCPPLANKAFTAANLNSMLEQRTKAFVNSNLNTITKDKLMLSNIFNWYKEDFGSVVAFINKYSNVKADQNASISFNEYNWALNK